MDHPHSMQPTLTVPAEALPGATVTLHPNLARLAVAYQRICDRFARGEIDRVAVGVELRELVARDDDGVQWTINPRDGGWLYLAHNGNWTPGEPPRSGLATLTPHDLSGNGATNPDHDIAWRATSDDDSTGIVGVTRRRSHQPPRELRRPRWVYPLLGALAVAAVILVALTVLSISRGVGGTDTPVPTTLPGLGAAPTVNGA